MKVYKFRMKLVDGRIKEGYVVGKDIDDVKKKYFGRIVYQRLLVGKEGERFERRWFEGQFRR